MSGIAAALAPFRPAPQQPRHSDLLSSLLGAMAHRAGAPLPSDSRPSTILREAIGTGRGASWSDSHCALGIQFMPRTPEDAYETQPLRHSDSGCVLVWDGRLDNREELHEALGAESSELSRMPDSALVLRAFLRWREECFARLLGDFALALWDARRQTLYAARDVMGVRPLFYHDGDRGLALASEVQALLRLPGVSRAPDEVMAGEALLWWTSFPEPQRTFYRDVRRLPPAHYLRCNAGGLLLQRYWDIDPSRSLRLRREEYVERYAGLLHKSVACRLRLQRRAGIFLSGGMDSSAVAAIAGRLAPACGVSAFHLQLVADENDEHALAQIVAQRASIPLHAIPLEARDAIEELDSYVRLQGAPFVDLPYANDLTLLYRAAHERCGVVMTGDGSDEVFNFAWAYVADLVRTGRWGRLARTIGPYAAYTGRRPAALLKHSLPFLAPRWTVRLWKRIKWRQAPRWLNSDFARASGMLRRIREAPRRRFGSACEQFDYNALMRGRRILADERRELDAAHLNLSYAFPFYDRRMLEFMFSVPWPDKVEGGRVKPFLRDAPGILPQELKDLRRKANYNPYDGRLTRAQNWRSLARVFDDLPPQSAQYVNSHELRATAERFLMQGAHAQRDHFLALALFVMWTRANHSRDSGEYKLPRMPPLDGQSDAPISRTAR